MVRLIAILTVALGAAATAQVRLGSAVDLRGHIDGQPAVRTRVMVWHNDMQKHTIEPIADGFAAADGCFAFDRVPWFAPQEWGGAFGRARRTW